MRLKAIEQRMAVIAEEIEKDDANLPELEKELDGLLEERKSLVESAEKRQNMLNKVAEGTIGTVLITGEERKGSIEMEGNIVASKEYRDAFLKSILGQKLTEVEERAYSSVAGSAGATIPTIVSDKMFEKIKKIAPMIEEITLLRVAGNVSFAVENARAAAAIHTENGTISDSSDTLLTVSLASYEITKVVSISKTVKTMSVVAFEDWLVSILAADIARAIDNLIINGTGSSQPTGIEKANTWGGTNKVDVATGVAVKVDDIVALIGLLPAGYDMNAKFLMNKKTLYTQLMNIQDTAKRPILFLDAQAGFSYKILGFPVIIDDYVTDNVVYFGDYTTVVGNMPEDINVTSSVESGFLRNAVDYLGCAMFDCKPAHGSAIVKLLKTP